MCGIAGIVEFGTESIRPEALLAMHQAIAHRGPDDEGYVLIDRVRDWCRDYAGASSSAKLKTQLPTLFRTSQSNGATVGLCHCRFSIIDLTDAGHQPFFDHERSCCVVYNGEIYNYLEVRAELATKGIVFRTESDTEVLLNAYKFWGTECFSKLNGFWAIALYDFKRRQLLVSRDRIGKKPLYWTRAGSRIYFASEIKALLRMQDVNRGRKVNEAAIFNWLAHGQKDLNFSTCFDGIYSLSSASWAILDEEFPDNVKTFWTVPKERMKESEISQRTATHTLRTLLEDSVSLRLRSDVPLSVELSGGMDSSTLVALAAQVRPGPLTTYTVRFPENEYNEEPFARSVAQRYKTDYVVLESPLSNFWGQILSFTYLEEEPYHAPNVQTNQAIWTLMRSMGTKVALNGAGGDENFAGYDSYFSLLQLENLIHGRFLTYLDNGIRYSEGRTNIRGLVSPVFKGLAKKLSEQLGLLAETRNGTKAPEPLSEALYSNMTNTLMPYYLRAGDRGYMGVPLEVRQPFLDYRVIEFAFHLPVTYLFRHGWHKWILRKAVEDILPADVVWRRRKLGFPFPFDRFYTENHEILDIVVNESHNPYLDYSSRSQFRRDWKTLSFILWYELFFNENLALFRKIQERARQMHTVEGCGYVPAFLHSEAFAQ
jgi:asparagine synthase (glutamine-hydrolysing)